MAFRELPTVDESISWGVQRGYGHAVVFPHPNLDRNQEIKRWLREHDSRHTYFRWPARPNDGGRGTQSVWCFKDPDIAFAFKVRFG